MGDGFGVAVAVGRRSAAGERVGRVGGAIVAAAGVGLAAFGGVADGIVADGAGVAVSAGVGDGGSVAGGVVAVAAGGGSGAMVEAGPEQPRLNAASDPAMI